MSRRDEVVAVRRSFTAVIDPIAQYQQWFAEAASRGGLDPKAACLTDRRRERPAVVADGAHPVRGRARLRLFHQSRQPKGRRDSRHVPPSALCVYWPAIDRQVRVEGEATPVDDDEADRLLGDAAAREPDRRVGVAPERSRSPRAIGSMTRVGEVEARFAGAAGAAAAVLVRLSAWCRIASNSGRHCPGGCTSATVFARDGASWRRHLLYP